MADDDAYTLESLIKALHGLLELMDGVPGVVPASEKTDETLAFDYDSTCGSKLSYAGTMCELSGYFGYLPDGTEYEIITTPITATVTRVAVRFVAPDEDA